MKKPVIIQKRVKIASGRQATVARKNASEKLLREADVISSIEEETDKRAKGATRAAIKKAKVCNSPVARFDLTEKRAYLEFADGKREYVE